MMNKSHQPINNTMIKLQVIGHLGKDATTNTANGKSVINFSVAHTEKYKNAQGQPQEKTTWVECAYWTDRTAIAPYLKKGTQVYVEGQPEVRTWEKDGKHGAALSVRVGMVQLLGGGQSTGQPQQTNDATHNAQDVRTGGGQSQVEQDLPF